MWLLAGCYTVETPFVYGAVSFLKVDTYICTCIWINLQQDRITCLQCLQAARDKMVFFSFHFIRYKIACVLVGPLIRVIRNVDLILCWYHHMHKPLKSPDWAFEMRVMRRWIGKCSYIMTSTPSCLIHGALMFTSWPGFQVWCQTSISVRLVRSLCLSLWKTTWLGLLGSFMIFKKKKLITVLVTSPVSCSGK